MYVVSHNYSYTIVRLKLDCLSLTIVRLKLDCGPHSSSCHGYYKLQAMLRTEIKTRKLIAWGVEQDRDHVIKISKGLTDLALTEFVSYTCYSTICLEEKF